MLLVTRVQSIIAGQLEVSQVFLLQLLFWSEVAGMSASLLPAVSSPWVQPGIALPTDHLVTVVLLCQDTERGFNHPTSQPQHQVQGGLLLYVVVRQCSAILQLLSGKDETLLVRRDSFLVLDFCFHILN